MRIGSEPCYDEERLLTHPRSSTLHAHSAPGTRSTSALRMAQSHVSTQPPHRSGSLTRPGRHCKSCSSERRVVQTQQGPDALPPGQRAPQGPVRSRAMAPRARPAPRSGSSGEPGECTYTGAVTGCVREPCAPVGTGIPCRPHFTRCQRLRTEGASVHLQVGPPAPVPAAREREADRERAVVRGAWGPCARPRTVRRETCRSCPSRST